jgi:hypothetical protein
MPKRITDLPGLQPIRVPIRDPNSRNQRRIRFRNLIPMRIVESLEEFTKHLEAGGCDHLKKQGGRISAEEVMQLEALLQKHKESGRYTVAVD